ncbi:unnamed protein product [Urochloa decumbens]|uniref:TF-B3 domain-containing protein n=1 Tax=Urochloa decumbens TaxID=240449 RepID=A0ABC8YXJ2_9POAL
MEGTGSEAVGVEVVAAAMPILDTQNTSEQDHESEENFRGGDHTGHQTPPKGRVMDGQSSTSFAQVAEPNLWYGDSTRLTPKQEEVALSLSRTCSSGIPPYICTMKRSNVVKRQLAFSREFSKRYIFPRLGTYGYETQVFAGNNLFGNKLNFSMIHGELRLLGGWPLFVKNNCIEAGHVCAFMFEEKEEGDLSLRVHVLGTMPLPTI